MTVWQSKTGYRYSLDAVILAWHARKCSGERVLDMGTGCGIISLIMAYREPSARYWGIDIQPELSEIAALNVDKNGLGSVISVCCRDLRTVRPEDLGGLFDRVVSNPPFRKSASGRINPDGQRAIARHEISATVDDIAAAARRLLRRGGKLFTLYPAERIVDVLTALRREGVEPKRLRMIQSHRGQRAKLCVVEGVLGGRPAVVVDPPLTVYAEDGRYTNEMVRIFQP
jgi:tRNA1Val (adenine37-N6)-methyltransferase